MPLMAIAVVLAATAPAGAAVPTVIAHSTSDSRSHPQESEPGAPPPDSSEAEQEQASEDAATVIDPPAGGSTISLWWENDSFWLGSNRTDRFYTNGIRVAGSWIDPPGWVGAASRRLLPFFGRLTEGAKPVQYGLFLGQSMYAPEDLEERELIPDDRPYAAWLYAGLSVTAERTRTLDYLELDVGVVGPAALGDQVQSFVHNSIVHSRDPGGWDNQLSNELGFLLVYSRMGRVFELERHDEDTGTDRRLMDFHLGVGGMLGNVFTNLATGASLRLGLVPSRFEPTGPMPAIRDDQKRWDVYAFASAEGRAVVHNIFLDGNTVASSHRVTKRPYVADLVLGARVRIPKVPVLNTEVTLTYRAVWRSPEFDERPKIQRFGSFTVTCALNP